MRPYIGAVVIHEDRDLPDHIYPPLRAVTPQRPPLFVECKLQRASSESIVGQFLAGFLQGIWLTVRQVTRPLVPAFEFAARAQGIEQNEVLQPPNIFRTETFKLAQRTARSRAQKVPRSLKQQRHLLREDPVVFDRSGSWTGSWRRVSRLDFRSLDPATLGQPFQANQQRVSSESRCRRVRGVAIAERPQRQNLPQTLAGGSEKIYELIGGRPEIANPAARRQRRGMQQNACGARKMHVALHSLLAAVAAQGLDLFFVSLDLARPGHLVDQAGNEKTEAFLLLAQQQLIADLIALRGVLNLGRLLVLDHLQYHSVRTAVDRTADLAPLHGEGNCRLSGHRAHLGHLRVGQNKVAGLNRCAHFFRHALQIMRCLGAVRQLLNFLREQDRRAFVLELFLHPAANFFEGRRGGRLHSQQLKHHDALRCRGHIRRRLFGGAEHRVHKLRRRAQSRQHVFASEEIRCDYRDALRCRSAIQALRASLLQQGLRLLLRDLLTFLVLQDWLNLGLHFVERLRVCSLLVVNANNVEAVAALYQIAGLPLGERERSLFKLGNGLAFTDPAQRSALLRPARVFGIFLGKILELV